MQYKPFGNTGIVLSRLGFGAMRLPMADGADKDHVDYDKALQIIHRAFELGVNYIDTAYGYCNGTSEIAVGKALKGWRDKVYLSTKCPMGHVSKPSDYRRLLEEQLRKLDTDHIDFYHFHALNGTVYREKVLGLNLFDEVAKAKDEGLIRYCSFSFHDRPVVMKEIIDSAQMTSVLCQYNLLDRSNEEMIAYAASKGVAVCIMGPVGGGRLAHPSEIITGLAPGAKSTAETALRFVFANPHVNVALSGMNTVQMVEENAAVASLVEALSPEEHQAIDEALRRNKELAALYCTGCEYCMPCPHGVNIAQNFKIMNYHRVYGLTDYARSLYAKLGGDSGLKAEACQECGTCEPKCPQRIPIIAQLQEVARSLGGQE
ncbi:MAG: aldo/keto reductase [Limnochordia bacterium]